MNITVIVKHSNEAPWEDSLKLYSCSSGKLRPDADPLQATSVFTLDQTPAIDIGTWQTWYSFQTAVENLVIPDTAEAPVDVAVYSFPRENKNGNSSLTLKQSALAKQFLTSVVQFVPRLRKDLSGVWVRVD